MKARVATTSKSRGLQRIAEVGRALGFRSGLEDTVNSAFNTSGVHVKYEDPASKIRYVIPSRPTVYTPDFKLPNGVLVETKGRFVTADRKKHKLIKEQFPHLDIRFVFSNPNARISKTSRTTYADWCNTHGFRYAAANRPTEWLGWAAEEPRQ